MPRRFFFGFACELLDDELSLPPSLSLSLLLLSSLLLSLLLLELEP